MHFHAGRAAPAAAHGARRDVSVSLDAVVPVQGRNLHDICHDLVLWSLRDERVGLHGLLAAALRRNPTNPQLRSSCSREWAGVTFTAPACPYPGMKPFTAAEQGRFYGREAEIQQAVDRLRRHPFLAIIGPSGSGKSSLLAAGILPALEKSHYFADKRWVVRTMRPGATPYDTLAALLDCAPRCSGADTAADWRAGSGPPMRHAAGGSHQAEEARAAAGGGPVRGAVYHGRGRAARAISSRRCCSSCRRPTST